MYFLVVSSGTMMVQKSKIAGDVAFIDSNNRCANIQYDLLQNVIALNLVVLVTDWTCSANPGMCPGAFCARMTVPPPLETPPSLGSYVSPPPTPSPRVFIIIRAATPPTPGPSPGVITANIPRIAHMSVNATPSARTRPARVPTARLQPYTDPSSSSRIVTPSPG